MFSLPQVALAAHPSTGRTLVVNLDDDPARETVIARNNVSFDHQYSRGEILAYDECAGQRRAHELSPRSAVNSGIVLRGIQGSKALGHTGVLFVVSYAGGGAIARVTRLRRPSSSGTCPVPVNLFEYSTDSPPRPPSRDNVIVNIGMAAGEYSHAPGRELRLIERYGKSLNGPISETRRTDFRYLRLQRRYIEYRSVLIPAR